MREYIDISYRLQKQWFDICKNYTVYHKPFSFIIPKLSGQEAHRLIDVSRVYKLGSSQLAMFGVYTIWGGDPTPYVKMDFNIANIPKNECPLLYVGMSGGTYYNDRKNKNSPNTYKKSSFLARMFGHQRRFTVEENLNGEKLYLMVLCPVDEDFYYGENRIGWMKAYEQTLMFEYKTASGEYPYYSKEYKSVDRFKPESISTLSKSRSPSIERWAENG